MNRFSIEDLNAERFTVTIEDFKDTLKLIIKGNIDLSLPQKVLRPLFNKIHDIALDNKLPAVYIDFIQLDFINSSGIRCFLDWVIKISSLEPASQYKIIFKIEMEREWQKESIHLIYKLFKNIAEFESE